MNRLLTAEAFVIVVDEGGFTAAARRLGVTKSYVSKLVSQLEERLGMRLLHRTTRKVTLTEPGLAYYERCNEAVRAMEDAEAEAAQLQQTPRGRLRVTLPTALCVPDLVRPITEFQARHPELTLDTFYTDRHVDLLSEGFDLAIRIGEVHEPSLIVRRLTQANRILCASPDYLARRGVPKEPEELSRHDCILYSLSAQQKVWKLKSSRRDVTVEVTGRVITNHACMLVEAARQGLGILLIPGIFCDEYLRDGQLLRILPSWELPTPMSAVFPGSRQPPRKVRMFADLMSEHFSAFPWKYLGEN